MDVAEPKVARVRVLDHVDQVATYANSAFDADDAIAVVRELRDSPASLWLSPGVPDYGTILVGERVLSSLGEQDLRSRVLAAARTAAELSCVAAGDSRSKDLLAQVDQSIEKINDRGLLLDVRCLRDCAIRDPDLIQERLANSEEIARLAAELADYRALHIAALARMTSFAELGDIQNADFHANMALSAARICDEPRFELGVRAYRTARAVGEGRFTEAEESFCRCGRIADELGEHELLGFCWPAMMAPFAEHGRQRELEKSARDALTRNPSNVLFRTLLAWLVMECGDLSEAEFHLDCLTLDDLVAVDSTRERLACMSLLVELSEGLDNTEVAAKLYDRMLPYAERVVTLGQCGLFGSVSRYLGKLAALTSRFDRAVEHLEHAIWVNRRIGARLWSVYSMYDLASLLVRRADPGDFDRARELLCDLCRETMSIGLPRTAEKIDSLRRAIRRNQRGAVPPFKPSLSAQSQKPETADEVASRLAAESAACVMRKAGDYWEISYEQRTIRLHHLKGFTIIQRLLGCPGRRFHVTEFDGGQWQSSDSPLRGQHGSLSDMANRDLGPALDAKAKQAYRERLKELREALEEAHELNDPGRALKSEKEIEHISRELARAIGLGGRDRKVGSELEKARLRVNKAIKLAVGRISAHHPALGKHFTESVVTGNFCSYSPSSSMPTWQL